MELIKWAIDPTHSEVHFKVKHLVITTVTGSFNQFEGTAEASENFETLSVLFEISANSITTNNEQRDAHLKSGDFFDVENFPKITFKSNNTNKISENESILSGELTVKGITKPVELKINYEGRATDPYGQIKAGFEVSGKINRHDFGLTWSALTEAGGAVVSDEVKLIANIQLIKLN